MRDDDDQAWRPAVPARASAVWERASARSDGGPRAAEVDDAGDLAPAAPDPAVSTAGPLRPPGRASSALTGVARAAAARWRRLTPTRRVAVLLGATALVAALVAVGGVAAGPEYAPVARASLEVDDLRTAPTTTAWSADLRSALAPGAEADCVGFDGSTRLGDDDVLVTTSAQGYVPDSGCEDAPGRLARLDARTGEVLWVADVAEAVGVDAIGLQASVDPATGDALVAVQSIVGSGLARIDTETGEVREVLRGPPDDGATGQVDESDGSDGSATGGADDGSDPGYDPEGSGPSTGTGTGTGTGSSTGTVLQVEGLSTTAVVVSEQPVERFSDGGAAVSQGGRSLYRLYRADDLSAPTWTGSAGAGLSVRLVGDLLVIDVGDEPLVVDARDGAVEPLPGGLRNVESWAASLDGVVLSGRAGGEPTMVSLDSDGALRWSARLPSTSYPSVTDSCISVTVPGGEVTCLDPRTGDELWSRTLQAPGRGGDGDGGPGSGEAEQVQAYFGTATDDVLAAVVDADEQGDPSGLDRGKEVHALAALSGDERWVTELPVASYVIATSRTTGYAATFFPSGRDTPTLIAFDLSDGRTLWTIELSSGSFTSAFWGPTLVRVDPDGVVHGLTTGVELAG
ncbi:PQQ-binding-like beta-propeller repeat protein [Frigoribacterium sp. CFBP 8766]|uniref:outer membrane protein assembly factor BamB family protein n=1 Tax=Frigoribacterium sp. CFBP 8766 TaxID=2775273 RepID=UPI001780A6AC|nr:PQQ-binding-like beta-propeller repeat protein [Frigoribacterium sp. CFBP 8766]